MTFDPLVVVEEVPADGLPEPDWSRSRVVSARGAWFVRVLEAVTRHGAVAVAALLPDGSHRMHDVDEASLWDATEGALTIYVLGGR